MSTITTARTRTSVQRAGPLSRHARPFARPRRRLDQALARGAAGGARLARRAGAHGGRADADLRAVGQRRAARRPDPQLRRRAHRRPARHRVPAALASAPSASPGSSWWRRSSSARASPASRRSRRLIHPSPPDHLAALAAAGVDRLRREPRRRRVRTRAGRRLDSPALIADGNHARADAYVSLAVIASAVAVAHRAADRRPAHRPRDHARDPAHHLAVVVDRAGSRPR